MTFTEYCVKVGYYMANHPSVRQGQAFFNVLHEERPDLADEIMRVKLDPFHNEEVLPQFLEYVEENWNDK